MIDASKIAAGDWVFNNVRWARVEDVNHDSVFYEPSLVCKKTSITAHRPKSGPFKVGDQVITRLVPVSEQTIKRIDGLRCFYDERAWVYEDEIDLVKPVEAIEAERTQQQKGEPMTERITDEDIEGYQTDVRRGVGLTLFESDKILTALKAERAECERLRAENDALVSCLTVRVARKEPAMTERIVLKPDPEFLKFLKLAAKEYAKFPAWKKGILESQAKPWKEKYRD